MEKILTLKEYLGEFKNIYQRTQVKEVALANFSIGMMKLLNGLVEMECTRFHKYEKEILLEGFTLFSKQCIEQMEEIERCEDAYKKKELLDDLEDSITKISDVYKDMIQGSADADRQMFHSLPLDTNVHEQSPKLNAFYASILKKLVKVTGNRPEEFAFIPYQVFQRLTDTKILLEERKKEGRVVIVDISDAIFEKVDIVSVYLLHEAFHVLSNSRMRFDRAKYIFTQMLLFMEQMLLADVRFDEDDTLDGEYRERLIGHWFMEADEFFENLNNVPKDSQDLYGRNIKKEIEQWFVNHLKFWMNDLQVSLDFVFKNVTFDSFDGYEKLYQTKANIICKIRTNMLECLINHKVEDVLDLLLVIYREAYADIGCVLVSELDVETYQAAIQESRQFHVRTDFYDFTQSLRVILVAEVVQTYLPEGKRKSWADYRTECQRLWDEKTWKTENEKRSKLICDQQPYALDLAIDDRCLGYFRRYLSNCASELFVRMDDSYRQKFTEGCRTLFNSQNKEKILLKILSGDVNFPENLKLEEV